MKMITTAIITVIASAALANDPHAATAGHEDKKMVKASAETCKDAEFAKAHEMDCKKFAPKK